MALEKEYKIGASTRTCHRCGRRLEVGEEYFSAVTDAGPDAGADEVFQRHDFCLGCWSPDPAAYFSFWKTRVPEPPPARPRGPRLVDPARLMELFEHLADADDPPARRFRYVLALVLMRKKRLRLVEGRRLRGGGEQLTLREVGTGRRHVVLCPTLSEEEIRSVTDRLGAVLDMPEAWDRLESEPAPVAGDAAPAEGGEDAGPAEPED